MAARSGSAYAPSPGDRLSTLTHLEDLGQIVAAAAEGPKRLFSLTEVGGAHLAENRAAAEAPLARPDSLRTTIGAIEVGPVWRAMQKLRVVLEARMIALRDKELQFTIVDLLDEIARKVERL